MKRPGWTMQERGWWTHDTAGGVVCYWHQWVATTPDGRSKRFRTLTRAMVWLEELAQ